MDEWKSKKERELATATFQPAGRPQKEPTEKSEVSIHWEEADWLLEAEESLAVEVLKRKHEKSPSKKTPQIKCK